MITIIQTKNGVSALWAPTPNHSIIAPPKPRELQNRLAVRWQALADYLVPIGYEDATGFHYGLEPAGTAGK